MTTIAETIFPEAPLIRPPLAKDPKVEKVKKDPKARRDPRARKALKVKRDPKVLHQASALNPLVVSAIIRALTQVCALALEQVADKHPVL